MIGDWRTAASKVTLALAGDGKTFHQTGIATSGERVELGRRNRRLFRAHRLFKPKMLAKKLDKMVWKPREVKVAPGITQRMVWL